MISAILSAGTSAISSFVSASSAVGEKREPSSRARATERRLVEVVAGVDDDLAEMSHALRIEIMPVADERSLCDEPPAARAKSRCDATRSPGSPDRVAGRGTPWALRSSARAARRPGAPRPLESSERPS